MKNPYKIAIVIDQLLPGGVQKAAIEEVRNLQKMGFQTNLLVLMRKGFESKHKYLVKGIDYQFLSDRYPKIFQKNIKLPIFRFLSILHLTSPIIAPFKIKSNEFDLLISHGTTTSLTTCTISRFCHIPYIAIVHDPMVYILEKVYSNTPLKPFFPLIKSIAHALEGYFVRTAKISLVDSSVHAKFIKNNYGITPQIIHLAVNPPKKTVTQLGDRIISFGRWDKGKNPDVFLEILKKIKDSKLIIAGSWSLNEDLVWFKDLVKANGLQNRIEIITHYQEKDLFKICKQARVWIHPHDEAFSLSALEAASLGLPIIISKKSGVSELFTNATHGFFPNLSSWQEFIKPIETLLRNKNLAEKMGSNAANLVKKSYTEKNRAECLSKIITAICQKPAKKMIALEIGHVGRDSISGGDLLLKEMIKHLTTEIQINVIIPENNKGHWHNLSSQVNLVPLSPTLFDQHTEPFLFFITYLIRIIKATILIIKTKNKENIILYSSTNVLPDVIPAFIAKFANKKIIWIARIHHLWQKPSERPGNYFTNLVANLLENIVLSAIKTNADVILVLNKELKSELESRKFPAIKIFIIGGGVDFNKINKHKSKKDHGYDAIFLGRLHPTKGIFDLPIIWKAVTDRLPKAKLVMIGSYQSNIKQELDQLIKDYSLEKNIKILGFLPQNQTFSLLRNSKVFLFTDHEAGWGLAVAEAMAAGLPVIGWNIGILGSVFKSGFIKITLDNHAEFSNSIIRVLTNKDFRKKLSKEARKEAKKHDWVKTANLFSKILNLKSN